MRENRYHFRFVLQNQECVIGRNLAVTVHIGGFDLRWGEFTDLCCKFQGEKRIADGDFAVAVGVAGGEGLFSKGDKGEAVFEGVGFSGGVCVAGDGEVFYLLPSYITNIIIIIITKRIIINACYGILDGYGG